MMRSNLTPRKSGNRIRSKQKVLNTADEVTHQDTNRYVPCADSVKNGKRKRLKQLVQNRWERAPLNPPQPNILLPTQSPVSVSHPLTVPHASLLAPEFAVTHSIFSFSNCAMAPLVRYASNSTHMNTTRKSRKKSHRLAFGSGTVEDGGEGEVPASI